MEQKKRSMRTIAGEATMGASIHDNCPAIVCGPGEPVVDYWPKGEHKPYTWARLAHEERGAPYDTILVRIDNGQGFCGLEHYKGKAYLLSPPGIEYASPYTRGQALNMIGVLLFKTGILFTAVDRPGGALEMPHEGWTE